MYRSIASDSAEVCGSTNVLSRFLMTVTQLDKSTTQLDLETLLNHMFSYFPFSIFTSHTSRRDIKVGSEHFLHELR